jgi:hypothetical protein
MTIVKRSECNLNPISGEVLTPAKFEAFCGNPARLAPDGGLVDSDPKSPSTLSLAIRILLFYGEEGLRNRFVVADPPINPKTGLSFGSDTKTYSDWASGLKVPVSRILNNRMLAKVRYYANYVTKHAVAGAIINGTSEHYTLDGTDAAIVREEGGLTLVGYCDWLLGTKFPVVEQRAIPAYLRIVDNLNTIHRNVQHRLFQHAFTSWVTNIGLKGKSQAIYICVEDSDNPRVGVYHAYNHVDHESIANTVESYKRNLDSHIWATGYEDRIHDVEL